MLVVFAAGAVALGWVRRARRGRGSYLLSLALAVTILVVYAADTVYSFAATGVDLPLHLSDLVPLAAAYALLSRRQWAYALTYYWGLVLSTQALVSPALTGPDV
ncbi:MAG: TIGR02206 family membrane protein, partial [Actinophytocola sp.]|nr:TIGR02206 family membrane protein [Actinophytocola sp.]